MKYFSIFFITFLLFSCSETKETTFTLLQLNTWLEGTNVENGTKKITDIISTTHPDIVTFSEVRNYEDTNWTATIVDSLNKEGKLYHGMYVAGDVSLISQFPILDTAIIFNEFETSDSGSIVAYLLNINNDKTWVISGHLDYKYYGLYLPRGYNGGDPNWDIITDDNGVISPLSNVDDILNYNKQSLKDEAVQKLIEFSNLHPDTTMLLGADFNDASHLDWTFRTQNLYDHNNLVIPWENTKLLEMNDFKDAYRELYPNELDYPGITWPAKATGYDGTITWTPQADERDRIDFVFYKGEGLKVAKGSLVGPRESFNKGEVVASTSKDLYIFDDKEWPSDHLGIFIEFEQK